MYQYDYKYNATKKIFSNEDFYISCNLKYILEKFSSQIRFISMNHWESESTLLISKNFQYWEPYFIGKYQVFHWFRNYWKSPVHIYLYEYFSQNINENFNHLLGETNMSVTEDICLFRQDGSLLFGSVKHERMACLYLKGY